MNNVPAQGRAQLAGIAKVYFVEHGLVTTWPLVVGGTLPQAHRLVAGAQFAQLAGTVYSATLESEGTDSQHGTSYAQVLEGFYAGDDAAATARFARMNGRRFLVVLRYFNGTMVAAGDQLAGLLFTHKFNSGTKPGQRKGHSWKFEAATRQPAAYLTQPIDVEGAGLQTPGQPSTEPAGTGDVLIYNSRGRLLATVTPGSTVKISSAFKVTIRVN